MPCRVVSYDEERRRAVVQPLFMTKERGKPPAPLPLVQNVPVLSQRYRVDGSPDTYEYVPVYQPGDVVFVAFSERALDAALAAPGQVVPPDSDRHHSLNDAVIVGVMAL
ncbi:Gp138 family membrane-puncturing spike protein [Paenibacillus mesophilus]|uniref:Gp138 family membrane-puncturing spike protein n=1 Tax=Paenibacillus mesophilus TaxID=2582849 RepID=UPI002367F755|nr:Gp138 family membrane-puncturing spike protein [Paenibacillus mesophilus]